MVVSCGHQDGACSRAWHRHVRKVGAGPFQQHRLRREEREVVSRGVAAQPPTARLVRWTARLGGWCARRREAVVPPVPRVAAVQVAVGATRGHAGTWLLLCEPADGRAARGGYVQEECDGCLGEHARQHQPLPCTRAAVPPCKECGCDTRAQAEVSYLHAYERVGLFGESTDARTYAQTYAMSLAQGFCAF